MADEPEHRPRLNHVAITMNPALLDDRGRADILDFYGEVFGWTEGDNTGESGNPLIMYTGEFGQFVYLAPGSSAHDTPALDHFGLQVSSRDEIEDIVARARVRQADDDRVRVSDVTSRITHGPSGDFTLTSAYVGFVLPMAIELQNIARRG